ncbi:MAG: META domain-containing protein [Chloroflexi bacterium]|nr:META domain-containing protein [Chloroflexota bacterium]
MPDPENYTLVFNEDGTFNAQVDCNRANGRYATSTTGSIFMEAGPMTMAACPEGSLDFSMTQMFGPAQSYRFEEAGTVLVFSWAAAGPVDYYRLLDVADIDLPEPAEGAASGTVTAPDGIFLRTGPGVNYPYVGAAPLAKPVKSSASAKMGNGGWLPRPICPAARCGPPLPLSMLKTQKTCPSSLARLPRSH